MKNVLVLGFLVLASCTTVDGYKASEVLERVDNEGNTPKWTNATLPFQEDGANLVFISSVTMNGNARTEACMKTASEMGKVSILKYFKDSITSSGQYSDSSNEQVAIESLNTFTAMGEVKGVKTSESYWEKRIESDENGKRIIKLHCAAKVSINKIAAQKQLEGKNPAGNAVVRKAQEEKTAEFIANVKE